MSRAGARSVFFVRKADTARACESVARRALAAGDVAKAVESFRLAAGAWQAATIYTRAALVIDDARRMAARLTAEADRLAATLAEESRA